MLAEVNADPRITRVEHGLIPEPPHPPAKVVQYHDVGIHVVQVVAVGWVLLAGPEVWTGTLF